MKIILIYVLVFLLCEKNQANKNAANHLKSLKCKQFRDRVYNMNAKYNQGIWYRIGKRLNNHQANNKNNNSANKTIKSKDKIVYTHRILFRIGKRSNSHDLKLHFENSQESVLPDYVKSLNYKGLKEKLEASINHEMNNQSIGIKYFKKIIEPPKQMRQKNIKNKPKQKNRILNKFIG
jgi:hypothetical protein